MAPHRLLVLVGSLLFLSSLTYAEKKSPYGVYLSASELKAKAEADESKYVDRRFGIEALETLITNNPGITSIETLIPNLPVSYLSNHTFITKSQSIQGASLEFPRVILYGNYMSTNTSANEVTRAARGFKGKYEKYDALTIAYKTHPNLPGARGITDDFVEVIDFKDGQFKFFEVKFLPGTTQRVSISKENPAKCMSCHLGTQNPLVANRAAPVTPRPIWKFRYPDWNDSLTTVYGDDRGASESPEGWKSFLEKNKNNPRVNQLIGNTDCYVHGANDCYPTPNVNIHMDAKIDWLNSQRVATELMNSVDYAKYKYAIYGSLKACNQIETFLPDPVRKQIRGNTSDYMNDSKKRINTRTNIVIDRQHQITGSIRYLFEGRGLNIKTWWTSFQPKSGMPKAGDGEIEYFRAAISKGYSAPARDYLSKAFEETAYAKNDSIIEFMPKLDDVVNSYNEPDVSCEKLKAKSLEVLGGVQ